PPSPQEPTEQAPEITPVSEPSSMPPEALESPRNSDNVITVNNDNPPLNEPEPISQKPESSSEIPETKTSQPQTAQTPVNEPLTQNKSSLARELLTKARNAIQFRKRKKLD